MGKRRRVNVEISSICT